MTFFTRRAFGVLRTFAFWGSPRGKNACQSLRAHEGRSFLCGGNRLLLRHGSSRAPRAVSVLGSLVRERSVLCALTFFVLSAPLFAERFSFNYTKGDTYRILSTVQEDVYFNGLFSHHAEIINRISVSLTDVQNGWGVHDATFMTSESSSNRAGMPVFTWGEEYKSVFRRSKLGKYDISDKYFMPVVRDVPIFPDKDLKPGDQWQAKGEEAHDLRRVFNYQKPFKVPFTVNYTYIGPVTVDGKALHKFTAQYTMNFTNKQRPVDRTLDYPYTTLGYSNQTIYWDAEKGCIDFYEEEFRIIIETAYGTTALFEGTARAEVSDLAATAPAAVAELQGQLQTMGVANTQVSETDRGITISLENIQFRADSAELMESEKEKLRIIAQLLQAYPDNDLLITGHTALAGTADSRQKLSEQRAEAVASFLIELGVKDAYHIFSKGYGAEKPISDNIAEAGRARNRRVEITILNK